VDVWAIAASLYYLLTGWVPRDFPTGRDPWMVIYKNDAVPVSQRGIAIPERLAEVIDQALVEEPEIYFKTAAEFKLALESAL
ncbi:MAG: serine/threonine protein kinase, partial [Blastocatellia bacterium]|nr:serine/threonine protein kinase [Blastocatellia bacterium]